MKISYFKKISNIEPTAVRYVIGKFETPKSGPIFHLATLKHQKL